MLAEDGVERLADERTFAAAANACDADESSERYLQIDVLEVVACAAAESYGGER